MHAWVLEFLKPLLKSLPCFFPEESIFQKQNNRALNWQENWWPTGNVGPAGSPSKEGLQRTAGTSELALEDGTLSSQWPHIPWCW